MNALESKKGFTIIEVVLVLAIAGLIFLMVFIALPALQRSQRDTQRENDLSRVQTQIQSYQSNNRGALPTNWPAFSTEYMQAGDDDFVDPSGKPYQFATTGSPDSDVYSDTEVTVIPIYVTPNATCGTDGAVETGAGSRKVAVRIALEGGGSACVNN